MTMRKVDPKGLFDYLTKFLDSGDYSRLIRRRFFRATIASVVANGVFPSTNTGIVAGQVGAPYALTLIRNGETTADGDVYFCSVPGYDPCVGDDVECVWRDESNALVIHPIKQGHLGSVTLGAAQANVTSQDRSGCDYTGTVVLNMSVNPANSATACIINFNKPFTASYQVSAFSVGNAQSEYTTSQNSQSSFNIFFHNSASGGFHNVGWIVRPLA